MFFKKKFKAPVVLESKIGVLLAELIGTFALAYVVLASVNGALAPIVPTAVIAAVTLALAVLAIGGISGAHINPAVTVGFWSAGKFSPAKTIGYIVAQLLGALAALGAMTLLTDGGVQTYDLTSTDWYVFAGEAVGAAVFTYGVAAAVSGKLKGVDSALLIGGSLFLGIVFASTTSIGVINPAVALTINTLSVDYLVAPLVGGIVGFNLFNYVAKLTK